MGVMGLYCVNALLLSASTGRVKMVHEGGVWLHQQDRLGVRLPQLFCACDYVDIPEVHGSRIFTSLPRVQACKARAQNISPTPAG